MKITVIGWYGTETIGDRAILAGIFSLLAKTLPSFSVKLGSLYPFFSERTLAEDLPFYTQICSRVLGIEIFNSKNKKELERFIDESDVLVMGGGPLMHINDMFMVDYAFAYAKKKGKKSIIFGCGVGPVHKKKIHKPLYRMLDNADVCILRDDIAKNYLTDKLNYKNGQNILTAVDPSAEAILEYKKLGLPYEKEDQDYIAINYRNFPSEYVSSHNVSGKEINTQLENLLQKIVERFEEKKVRLIPMHYFHIGDDDRVFFNEVMHRKDFYKKIDVQNDPLSLVETFQVFENAWVNIGMRFHSVVLQSLLKGNNYILDYTEPKIGKISGFVDLLSEKQEILENRYVCLQENPAALNDLVDKFGPQTVITSTNIIEQRLAIYTESLNKLFNSI
jgi:polysaccharide pyruvyl transferase WcaK-like protein